MDASLDGDMSCTICKLHDRVGQLLLVSNFCTRIINPMVHMALCLYSVSGYCLLMWQTMLCMLVKRLTHKSEHR